MSDALPSYREGFNHGTPITITDAARPNLTQKLIARVAIDLSSGCWLWTGAKGKNGYGRINVGGNTVRFAHRVAYALFIGPIPTGMELDHKCRNHPCVNPSHLEPVTRRENLLRGDTFAARHAAKTHCPRGHEYTEANTNIDSKRRRSCRACRTVAA